MQQGNWKKKYRVSDISLTKLFFFNVFGFFLQPKVPERVCSRAELILVTCNSLQMIFNFCILHLLKILGTFSWFLGISHNATSLISDS